VRAKQLVLFKSSQKPRQYSFAKGYNRYKFPSSMSPLHALVEVAGDTNNAACRLRKRRSSARPMAQVEWCQTPLGIESGRHVTQLIFIGRRGCRQDRTSFCHCDWIDRDLYVRCVQREVACSKHILACVVLCCSGQHRPLFTYVDS
jgi:hypothetical protein